MTNLKTSHVARVVLAAAAAVVLAGCSGGSSAPTPTPSATPSPSVSTTPTPSASPSPTPSSVSERAAVDAVIAYNQVIDKLGADPNSDLDELNTVATGDALAQWQHILAGYRIDGWRKTGEQIPTFVGSTPGASAAEWLVSMCIDLSGVDLLDASGVSVKNPDGPSRVLTDFSVEQGVNGQWYVAKDEVRSTC